MYCAMASTMYSDIEIPWASDSSRIFSLKARASELPCTVNVIDAVLRHSFRHESDELIEFLRALKECYCY